MTDESVGGAASPMAAGASGDDPLIGRVLNERVRIVRPIARGGMGKVYCGEQVSMGRACAVKVLDPLLVHGHGRDENDFAKRFLLEASVSSKLTHPNVVTIFDYGQTEDDICYIAMEYLEGRTLSEELRATGRLPWERTVSIARQICRALREAHALGVVHRDMKPGNVFLAKHDDEGDFVKVLDFGLVKDNHAEAEAVQQTQMGQIMGSPRYMAPEQIQGAHVDARTDIYSTGAVLYAMLTGKPPFERANEMATMMAHMSDRVLPLRAAAPDILVPEGLEQIVLKCLEKDPARRYGSMEELLVALKLQAPFTILSAGSGSHSVASVASVSVPAPGRKRSRAWIPALAVTGLAFGVAIVALHRGGEPTEGTAGTPGAPAAAAPPPPSGAPVSAPPPAPAAAPAATLTMHLETTPPGARVKEDDLVVCASTPCDVIYKGDAADAAIEHLLVFQKAGYKVERKIVKTGGEPVVVPLQRQR